jgi:hypothetical protein
MEQDEDITIGKFTDSYNRLDLTGWVCILTYGDGLDIYGKGDDRVGIERSSGKVILQYKVKGTCLTERGYTYSPP